MKRRLLSLFMAMVMVCTLVPVALATEEITGSITPTTTNCKVGSSVNLSVSATAPTGYTISGYEWKEEEKTTGSQQSNARTDETNAHTFSPKKAGTWDIKCTVSATKDSEVNGASVQADSPITKVFTATVTVTDNYTITLDKSDLSLKQGGEDTLTAKVKKNDTAESNPTVTWASSKESVATVDNGKVTAKDSGEATITATFKNGSDEYKATCKVTVTSPVSITVSSGSTSFTSPHDSVKLTANYTGTNPSYRWTYEGDKTSFDWDEKDNQVTIYPYGSSSTTRRLVAKVTVTDNGETYTAEKEITSNIRADIEVSATVSGDYFLGDADDKSNYSIWERIEDELEDYNSSYTLVEVRFDETEHEYGELNASDKEWYDEDGLDTIEFIADGKGTAEFPLTVRYEDRRGDKDTLDGLLTIKVTDTVSSSRGDITYTAELGEDFYFDVGDFEDYFDDKFSSGSLDYVIFNSASNGKVKDGRSTVSYDKDEYYVDPGRNDNDLADVYFSPNSSSKAMTGKVNFTVYGKKNSQSREGTIVIYYLNDSASDITYSTTGGKVTLDPKDFEDAYKEATGSKTAPSGLTIEFQNVPTNGTLTYTGGSRDKDLTKSNVKSNRYTTKSSGSYRLAQLTYSGTKGTDTIDYIAYSGGTAQFSGKVVFNGAPAVPTDVVVGPFYSTAGQPAAFNLNTFTAASSAISNAVKVRFVAPANGTLTMSGASAAGIDVATSLLNLVSYQPKAGYNGTDQIIFAAYDAKNAVVASGTVNVQVIGNPTTTTPTTPGGSTGVTDVSQFKDVASGAWYRDNLATLVKKGVISGRGDGKFDPKGTVTYGEALKMVLEACGYTATVGTGSQWAINYKNLAVSRGWISNDIDLNAAISRNATAELAARVLGVERVTSGSPFADDANAYAVALYYTTPQIFVGTTNPNGGKPLFENNKPLLREQVCAVICRVMDYHTQHTTNTMPDGI